MKNLVNITKHLFLGHGCLTFLCRRNVDQPHVTDKAFNVAIDLLQLSSTLIGQPLQLYPSGDTTSSKLFQVIKMDS